MEFTGAVSDVVQAPIVESLARGEGAASGESHATLAGDISGSNGEDGGPDLRRATIIHDTLLACEPTVVGLILQ